MGFKILSLLVSIGLISSQSSQPQIDFSEYLGGNNKGLESITPLGVLKEIYKSASKNPGLVTFLHLSFSELFHNTQLWASLNSSNVFMVKPRSDSLELELASALRNAPSDVEKQSLQQLINTKDEIINRVFSQNEFSYLSSPTRVTSRSPKEDLISLIDKDRLISSFRISTLHNILTDALAMLSLAQSNPFQRFSSDQIFWSKPWWKYLTVAYGNRREFLSRDKQMMVGLRFLIYTLVEVRLHRTEAQDFRDSLDNKLLSFTEEFQKLLKHQEIISMAQTHILEKLSELGEPSINSGLSEDECDECVCTTTPCPEVMTDLLESKLRSLEQNVQKILSRLNILDLFSDTKEISMNIHKLKDDLNQFSTQFTFLTKINNQITEIFEKYQLIYITYTILAAVLLLVLIKVLNFSLYLLSCFKECCQVSKDLCDFLKQRKENRIQENRPPEARHQEEAPFPLVNYRQR